MKRRAPTTSPKKPRAKRPRADTKAYCDVEPRRDDETGNMIWPAPDDEMDQARRAIRECAATNAPTVICPDKDADGLTSGVILYRTLSHLGLSPDRIKVHLLPKGETVHTDSQRAAIAALLSDDDSQPSTTTAANTHRYLFVLDHGTASSPSLAPPSTTTTLIIDHHFSGPATFPEASLHVNASHCPPVPTTALLTHELCAPLYPDLRDPALAWLCAVGTHGDLGTSLAWTPPFPDMRAVFAAHSKKRINETVSLLNAPRRAPAYDVRAAWTALLAADDPAALLASPAAAPLRAARDQVNAEVARCQAAPPKFSADGTLAVVRIQSPAQVHPVIATRWAGTLSSRKLRIVMCANDAYLPGKVNFSCRIARCALARAAEDASSDGARQSRADEEGKADAGQDETGSRAGGASAADGDGAVDIIASLNAWASQHPSGDLRARLGSEFARGHVQASGGIVGAREFEELMSVMRVGDKSTTASSGSGKAKAKTGAKVVDEGQTRKVTDFFKRKDGV